MSDAPVLALKPAGPLARQLLESGRTDKPEPGARDRALVAFGFAPLGVLAVAPPSAAAVASGPAGALTTGSKSAAWLVGKSVAMGALGSVLTIGLIQSAVTRLTPTAPTESHEVGPSAAPGVSVPISASASHSASPAPSVVNALPPAPKKAQKAPELPPTELEPRASPLAVAVDSNRLVELEALAGVRRALSARESARALSMLDDFARRFPASHVTEEAAVLRIETLRALGRISEAHALAQRFLRERPSSVYGAKVNAMMTRP